MLEFRWDWRLCMTVYLEVMGAQGSLGGSPFERTYNNMVRGSRARLDLRRPGQENKGCTVARDLDARICFHLSSQVQLR